jgi:hypothetical protein
VGLLVLGRVIFLGRFIHVEAETVFFGEVFILHFELDVFPGHFDFSFLQKGLVHLGLVNHVVL